MKTGNLNGIGAQKTVKELNREKSVPALLDTVRIVSVSSLHVSRCFTVTPKLHRNIINIKLTSNGMNAPLFDISYQRTEEACLCK